MYPRRNNKDIIELCNIVNKERVVQYLGVSEYKERNGNLIFRCLNPSHKDSNPSMILSLDTGLWNCWSCSWRDNGKGALPFLIMKAKNVSFTRAVEILEEIAGVKTSSLIYDTTLSGKFYKPKTKADKSMSEIELPECIDAKNHKAIVDRGIAPEIAEKFGVKLCIKGFYKNRLIIPIYHEGKLVSFAARTIVGDEPKYLYPKGTKVSQLLFNYNAKASKVVVVEGVFDCMKICQAGYDSVAVLGGVLSGTHLQLLSSCKKIMLMPDYDEGEHKNKMNTRLIDSALPLLHKVSLYVAQISPGSDPADLSTKEIVDYVMYAQTLFRYRASKIVVKKPEKVEKLKNLG